MKILIASDSYKGSCSSRSVAQAMEEGIKKVDESIVVEKLILADGGEGTMDSLVEARGGYIKSHLVLDPLARKVEARYGILPNKIGIIEMAEASGLDLLKEEELNPLLTTSYGTGELIKYMLEEDVDKIYIGIGGSATNDGGVGMAQALGISFRDKEDREVGFGGGSLGNIDSIKMDRVDKRLKEKEFIIISDVDNLLCGEEGASRVYGPQKGASEEDINILDKNLNHLGSVVMDKLGVDIKNIKGGGAAGGLGGGLVAFCNGKMMSGIDTILDIIGIDNHLKDVDLVITGEGRIDGQSIYGKVPVGVAKRAKKYNKPVIAIVGSVGKDAHLTYDHGIDLIVDIINRPMSLEDAKENCKVLIEEATKNIVNFFTRVVMNYGGEK